MYKKIMYKNTVIDNFALQWTWYLDVFLYIFNSFSFNYFLITVLITLILFRKSHFSNKQFSKPATMLYNVYIYCYNNKT